MLTKYEKLRVFDMVQEIRERMNCEIPSNVVSREYDGKSIDRLLKYLTIQVPTVE